MMKIEDIIKKYQFKYGQTIDSEYIRENVNIDKKLMIVIEELKRIYWGN